jgi:hypothetical protein
VIIISYSLLLLSFVFCKKKCIFILFYKIMVIEALIIIYICDYFLCEVLCNKCGILCTVCFAYCFPLFAIFSLTLVYQALLILICRNQSACLTLSHEPLDRLA